MRIISGKYKNRILKSIPGNFVRPTSGIVRKSVFEILHPLKNKKILDLFSGTGSLGIEALSRGALSVTFVEKDKKVFKVLLNNIESICKQEHFNVINKDVFFFLKAHSKKYDIIFADPPYSLIQFDKLKLIISDFLNYGGIFCMENRYQKAEYEDAKIKNYGKTQIIIWEKKEK